MGWLRAVWRLLLLLGFTLIHFGLYLGGRLAAATTRLPAVQWRNRAFRAWAHRVLRIMRIEVRVSGVPPTAPFFLVSNHLSYMDVVVLASQLDAVFVAKSEIARWPLVGMLCRTVGTVFIDRNLRRDIPRAVGQLRQVMERGQGVVVFPEGTSTKGETVERFRPSLLEAAVHSGYPVAYASLGYSTPEDERPAHMAVCWWGGMGFAGHLFNMLKLRRFQARVRFGAETYMEADRKLLARRLQQAVLEGFTPVVEREETCA